MSNFTKASAMESQLKGVLEMLLFIYLFVKEHLKCHKWWESFAKNISKDVTTIKNIGMHKSC